MIRTLIIDMDVPEHADGGPAWSSTEMTDRLRAAGFEHAFVWGALDRGGIRATRHKLNQLNREIENDDSKGNLTHSGHKALSFFIEMWPVRFWRYVKEAE